MVNQKKGKISTQAFDKEIDNALIADPPVYASGSYYVKMSKKFKVTQIYIKERCIELGLINIYKRKVI